MAQPHWVHCDIRILKMDVLSKSFIYHTEPTISLCVSRFLRYLQALAQPQWIRCDIRTLKMDVLGKFGVIMADPPWRVRAWPHMAVALISWGAIRGNSTGKFGVVMADLAGGCVQWVHGHGP